MIRNIHSIIANSEIGHKPEIGHKLEITHY